MFGRTRAEREWMADVTAQMIRDELLDDEDDWGLAGAEEPKQITCNSCAGVGIVEIGDEVLTCDDCSGTGLIEED